MKNIASFLGLAGLTIAAPFTVLRTRDLSSDTENQLTNGTACRDLTIIFARGTFEEGNVGTLVGPPFFQAVADIITEDKFAVQGVDYPADVDGFYAGGDVTGSQTMADLVVQAQTQCPDTKVAMAGYSQGGQLVHNAAKLLNSTQSAGVNSVVIFGDPDEGQAVGSIANSSVLLICHTGDDICLGGDNITKAHLTYSQDATTAAQFVVSLAGFA